MRHRPRLLTAALALVLVAAACGGGDDDSSGGGDGPGGSGDTAGAASVDPAECGLDEFAAAPKPVEVTMWHATNRAGAEAVEEMVRRFEASQDDVRVELIQQPGYVDSLTKYLAGLGTGDLPSIVHLEETAVQKVLDSRSTIPMQACVDADSYDTADFVPRALEYYSTDGVLRAMPWTVSNPVLMFNRTAFEAAGLDPDDPPATLDEVRAAAQKIVDTKAAKHGIALRIEPYILEFLYAKSGLQYVNEENGRAGRATEAELATEGGTEIWTWWKDMVDSGLALDTGGAPGNFDHLLAVGNGNAAMAFEASSVLGTIRQVLESGQYEGVKIDASPLPALTEGGGVPVGDGALWIPEDAEPAVRGAAWQLVKFLSEPEQQAYLAAQAGFVPIRQSATQDPDLQAVWAEEPAFEVSYNQLVEGPNTPATVGSLIGDYQGVRDAVRDGMTTMLAEGTEPAAAVRSAADAASASMQEYNARVGE